MSYGLGATIALASGPAMPRIPVPSKGISLSTPNATPWGTVLRTPLPVLKIPAPRRPAPVLPKTPVLSRPIIQTMPVLKVPVAPVLKTPVAAPPVVLKPSVLTAPAPKPQLSVAIPHGASTGTSLVPLSSANDGSAEIGTLDTEKSPVLLIGLGLLALFLLSGRR